MCYYKIITEILCLYIFLRKEEYNVHKKSRPNLKVLLTLLLFCFALVNIFNIIKLTHEKGQKTAELEKIIQKKEKQQETNQKLSKQSLQGFNKEYIEQKARELFNYVYPEEHIFIDTSGNS